MTIQGVDQLGEFTWMEDVAEATYQQGSNPTGLTEYMGSNTWYLYYRLRLISEIIVQFYYVLAIGKLVRCMEDVDFIATTLHKYKRRDR
jgi:hypothetical protein